MLGVRPVTGQVLGLAEAGQGPATTHLAFVPPTGQRVSEYDFQGPPAGGRTVTLAAVGLRALPLTVGALQHTDDGQECRIGNQVAAWACVCAHKSYGRRHAARCWALPLTRQRASQMSGCWSAGWCRLWTWCPQPQRGTVTGERQRQHHVDATLWLEQVPHNLQSSPCHCTWTIQSSTGPALPRVT